MLAIDIATAAILALAAAASTLAAVGVAKSRNNFAAIHCSSAAAILTPPLALIAVIIQVPLGQPTLQMLLVTVTLLIGAPITSHIIGMAEYRRKPRT
ncbi:MAG TPA: monovalent cation/H(+) antiporter subunit G [Candidatus Baltobacteraceae bacterium]|nr:monovalent cation/H(+) antiporter subunit G [Candidatus Baltobacteraceae bacterium]